MTWTIQYEPALTLAQYLCTPHYVLPESDPRPPRAVLVPPGLGAYHPTYSHYHLHDSSILQMRKLRQKRPIYMG